MARRYANEQALPQNATPEQRGQAQAFESRVYANTYPEHGPEDRAIGTGKKFRAGRRAALLAPGDSPQWRANMASRGGQRPLLDSLRQGMSDYGRQEMGYENENARLERKARRGKARRGKARR